ncbi:unnamed protein product [Caenorhabditis auriculariae]|uniref:Uncharacterized protein n=1 Tax=Caenorhabditis auriculariae TaxID=2777116 RepID=A0A8S1HJ25_9PELO|nr:unnamed protein product [Caenorhabditis auriculariae]
MSKLWKTVVFSLFIRSILPYELENFDQNLICPSIKDGDLTTRTELAYVFCPRNSRCFVEIKPKKADRENQIKMVINVGCTADNVFLDLCKKTGENCVHSYTPKSVYASTICCASNPSQVFRTIGYRIMYESEFKRVRNILRDSERLHNFDDYKDNPIDKVWLVVIIVLSSVVFGMSVMCSILTLLQYRYY